MALRLIARFAALALAAMTLAACNEASIPKDLKPLPAKLVAKLHPALVKLILQRTGIGWVPKLFKLWPVVGAPIGYVIDSTAVAALGRDAIRTLEQNAASSTPPDAVH